MRRTGTPAQRRERRAGRCAALCVAVGAAAGVLVSCDSHQAPAAAPSSPHPESSTPTAHPSMSAATGDRSAVEEAYRRFWSVSWSLDRRPRAEWRATLATVAVDPALTRALAGTDVHQRDGITLYGKVVAHVREVRITAGQARLVDCQDASHAGQADAKTGQPKNVGVAHAPVVALLVRGRDNLWRVSQARYTGGEC